MNFIKSIIYRLRGDYTTERLVKMGLVVGKNFCRMNGVILDPSHCWLIKIGDSVTLAPSVHILCHDASTKMFLNYTKIGRVNIGDNVFIGANSIVLPNVTIGSNVIVGANSTITKDIPDNVVVAGSPAKIISSTEEYIAKEKLNMNCSPCYGFEFTLKGNISNCNKEKQKNDLEKGIGYIL